MLSSPIEDIKSRLDIVEVISGYIKLQKTGANWRANCPFHGEKTPSFFVSPSRQIWHCFGCSKGGDVFGFVKEIEGVEFGDALKILAQRAGVELKPFRPEMKELSTERARYYEICDLATSFFEKQLGSSAAGKTAEQYLLGRGINEESIKRWRLGYAPDVWQGLIDFLVARGYKKPEIEKAGLAIKKPDGGFYDRFRGRIIFPVFDLNSQVIGYGGRVISRPGAEVAAAPSGIPSRKPDLTADKVGIGTAKYINTPATLLYDKSRTLYGLDKAKVEIRQKDVCILVEGYTDAILSHQAGILNAVAVSGTALTPWHLKILHRYTENLLISFDMDLAGDTATKRGIDLALSQGFNIKVVLLPEGKDPAELVLKSPASWEESIKEAKSILEFYFETTLKRFNKDLVEGKKDISRLLLAVIKKIPNKIEQTFWLQRLSRELGAKEEDLVEEMGKIRHEEDVLGLEPEEVINLPQSSRRELLEERLIALILKNRQSLERLSKDDLFYFSPQTRSIISAFWESPDNEAAFRKLNPPELEKVNCLSLRAEMLQDLTEKERGIDFNDCLREIKNREIRLKLEALSQEIRTAETAKDLDKVASLISEFHLLSQKLSED